MPKYGMHLYFSNKYMVPNIKYVYVVTYDLFCFNKSKIFMSDSLAQHSAPVSDIIKTMKDTNSVTVSEPVHVVPQCR